MKALVFMIVRRLVVAALGLTQADSSRRSVAGRPACVLCALKHVAQARALMLEACRGYPEHYWFALGHLAEAEDELVLGYPDLANTVRAHRKELELYPRYEIPFVELVNQISVTAGYDASVLLPE